MTSTPSILLLVAVFLNGIHSQGSYAGDYVGGAQLGSFENFGEVTVTADFNVNGPGSNIDSLAFWETPNSSEFRMFVSSKNGKLVEVWTFPFEDTTAESFVISHGVNGVDVDQDTNKLFVSGDGLVSKFSLPNLNFETTFGGGHVSSGETNIDILDLPNGNKRIYVTDDSPAVHIFDPNSGSFIGQWDMNPYADGGIEEVLADSFYQVLYVPREDSGGGGSNAGMYAFDPAGNPFLRNATNRFAANSYEEDAEGLALYTCSSNGFGDDGEGFIISTDQDNPLSGFLFFERKSWKYLGTVRIAGVNNTDGIASTQKALPGYPEGIFAAVDDDTSAVGVGWDKIFKEIRKIRPNFEC
ncbi:MAG: phytase [Gammaproteobacteria bacterium]|nr:phytase [Gammaproteobacteria bacterium]